jgi:hypothetical protein
MQGKLIVKMNSAKLTKDTDFFSKMDPYVILKIGAQVLKTKVAKSMGKTPVWNDIFEVQLRGEDCIQISLFDKDLGSKDDFIAEGAITLTDLLSTDKTDRWFPLQRKGKSAGNIHVGLEFIPTKKEKSNQENNNVLSYQIPPSYGQQTQQYYGQAPQPFYGQAPQPLYAQQSQPLYTPPLQHQQSYGYPLQTGYGYPPQPINGHPSHPGYIYPPQNGFGYQPHF